MQGSNLAIVSGASKGLGNVICAHLQRAGYTVAGLDKSDESPNNVEIFPCDLSRLDEIGSTVEVIVRKHGSPKLCVSNAGALGTSKFDECHFSEIRNCVHVNLIAPVLLARACARHMVRGGLLLFISSISAVRGSACHPAYSASKAGIDGLVASLAKRYAANGIRAVSIAPGSIQNTSFNEDSWHHLSNMERAASRLRLLRAIPSRRILEPSDVADWVTFLADNDRSANGVSLRVDGGEILK